jgi:predicted ATPase
MDGSSLLPSRLGVVIGYNGSGKTRLLTHLAQLGCADRFEAEKQPFVSQYGRFVGPRPTFGSIISVSYSAFDEFLLPEGVGSRAVARNYTYCGLRRTKQIRRARSSGTATPPNAQVGLKTFEEIADEFHGARARSIQSDRSELLMEATAFLLKDPSFGTTVALPPIDDETEDEWVGAFAALSAGHKIVLNIVVQLCAFIQLRSLVLLDEPELHLHPPLVAALLRAIGVILDRYGSFGVVATHSPVVLQEIPSANVVVLRRYFDTTEIERPDSETYAENVGLLTRQVFNLDSSATDYEGVLHRLSEEFTLNEIEELFPKGLSSQGRALVLSLRRDEQDPP